MEHGAGGVYGFDCFVMCRGSALRGLVAMRLEEDAGIFVGVCVAEVESFGAADVIEDVVEKVECWSS